MLLTGNFVFAPDVSRLKRRGEYGKRAGADREGRDLPTPTRAHPRGDVWLRLEAIPVTLLKDHSVGYFGPNGFSISLPVCELQSG